ncbi:histone lysine demethylase PHF8-like [Sminthopsis crassicaudata]|uniref:histone lysine demethylase PHF8-like n=1 Tax=Sminthopsis crassicaudata TaxID=9301 RepID=UPI003D687A28
MEVSGFSRSRNSKAKRKGQTKVKLRALSKRQPKPKISEQCDPGSKEELKVEARPQKEQALARKKRSPKFHQKLLPARPCSDPNRLQEPGEVECETEENYTAENKAEERVEAEAEAPGGTCGILYLLKASRQLGEPDCIGHNKAPVSPTTLEAAHTLLSLANQQPGSSLAPASSVQAWWASEDSSGSSGSSREKSSGPLASQGTGKKKAVKQLANYCSGSQEGEVETHELRNLDNSFRDEAYNFLESDEDEFVSKLKSKKKKKKSAEDAPWIPKVSLEEAQVKEVLSKKQETLTTLSLHCQEKNTEAPRQLAVTEERKKRITELSSNFQEGRLKKRKQREALVPACWMESGQQGEGMMEKHKRADILAQELSSSMEKLRMEGEEPHVGGRDRVEVRRESITSLSHEAEPKTAVSTCAQSSGRAAGQGRGNPRGERL